MAATGKAFHGATLPEDGVRPFAETFGERPADHIYRAEISLKRIFAAVKLASISGNSCRTGFSWRNVRFCRLSDAPE
jgi:hypothetical protein